MNLTSSERRKSERKDIGRTIKVIKLKERVLPEIRGSTLHGHPFYFTLRLMTPLDHPTS